MLLTFPWLTVRVYGDGCIYSCRVTSTPRQVRTGYAIHVLTASGAAVGMFALQSIFDGDTRMALVWLLLSQVLDGLDGPIARKYNVVVHAPRINGHILDLVVDYVTCVVVPIAFMAHANMLPEKNESILAGFIMLFSALWFARTDLETEDLWFNGFPAAWNLAVPALFLAHANIMTVEIVSVILCISQLTNFQVPHIVSSEWMRQITLPFGILFLADLAYISWNYNNVTGYELSNITGGILFAFPVYAFFIGLVRTIRLRNQSRALPVN